MDCVICGVDARLDREVLGAHSWLPPRTGPMSAAWSRRDLHGRPTGGRARRDLYGRPTGGRARRDRHGNEALGLSLYRANLVRKWGEAFRARYLDRAIARQLAWGFTSIGNWSDHALFRFRALPWFSSGPAHSGIRTGYVARLIHDAFDPRFPAEAMAAARPLSASAQDPWLVGHFISNEVGWDEFPAKVLALPPGRPAKRELLRRLRRKYGGIRKLNRAWRASARSFADLRWPADSVRTAEAEGDMASFRADFADRWYSAWSRAIRSADPNHLVLGSRLNQGARPLDVLVASARHNDVVSFNHYDYEPWRGEFEAYYALARKPFIMGEYGHNSTDRGLLTAAVPVRDQRARAVGYRCYTEQLAAMPFFVGGHFFQYLDEPITGRFDRETAFNGFVSVADIPCPLMVAAARAAHARVYPVHAGLAAPFSRRPEL
jgi:agarase